LSVCQKVNVAIENQREDAYRALQEKVELLSRPYQRYPEWWTRPREHAQTEDLVCETTAPEVPATKQKRTQIVRDKRPGIKKKRPFDVPLQGRG
jgi:hypothetical protein